MQLAMFHFVPDLPRAHALEIDVFGLLVNGDGENLRRHLLERHERPFSGIAGARANRLVFIVTGLQVLFGGLNRLAHQFVPERQATLGLAHAELDPSAAEAGRINPFV